jgi:hypothetical protein
MGITLLSYKDQLLLPENAYTILPKTYKIAISCGTGRYAFM